MSDDRVMFACGKADLKTLDRSDTHDAVILATLMAAQKLALDGWLPPAEPHSFSIDDKRIITVLLRSTVRLVS